MDRFNQQQCRRKTGRMLVPLLLILALPIAGMVAFVLYHKKAALKTDIPTAAKATVSFGTADWPVFRGDSQLTGRVEGELPGTLKLAWTFKTTAEILSTPVIADNTAYVSSMDHHLYALDLSSGTERWRFEADDELEASPVFHDGVIYIGSSGGVFYAIDAATGTVRWTFDKAGKITGSANIALPSEDSEPIIVFGSYDNHLYGLDTAGMQVVDAEAANYINGSVAVAEGIVFFGSCDANVYMIPLAHPEKIQTIDAGSYVAASCAVADGIIYAGNYEGRFFAAEVATQTIIWQYEDTEDAFFSSPAIGESAVVVGCRDGKLYCFDRKTGNVRWTFEATDNFDSSPVICGDKVIVGNDDGRLYLIDLNKGTELFSYTLGASVAASPAIAQNYILIGCGNGTLYAFTNP